MKNHLLLLTLLGVFLVACGQPAQPNPNLLLNLNQTSLSVLQGDSVQTTLTLTPQNGFSGTVNLALQNPPAGVTLSPTSVTLNGSAPQNLPLNFSTTASTPTGPQTLTLVASQGSLRKTASFQLTVTDFSISLDADQTMRAQGQSFSDFNLILTPVAGFSDSVSLSLQSPPSGISIAPTSLSASGPLTLSVDRSVPAGVYPLTLVASSGGVNRTATLSLRVLQARSLAAGGYFSAAVMPSGELWTWGQNDKGQLGRSTSGTEEPTPAVVSALSGVASVALGEKHALVLLENGEVRAFGSDQYGQLGDGPGDSSGSNANPSIVTPSSLPARVVAVAAGHSYSLALLSDGTVQAWGRNDVGQLGIGNNTTPQASPMLVSSLNNVVIALAAGLDHTLALAADGSIWAWGDNPNGELGTGDNTFTYSPVQLTGITAKAIAAGGNHSVALLSNGTVRTWGYNNHGQLGDGSTTSSNTPVSVTGLANVADIAAGYEFTLALLTDGTVKAWGDDSSFQLGNGSTTGDQLTPVDVQGLPSTPPTPRGLAAGIFHAMALLDNGEVYAWGRNAEGQLGDGTIIPSDAAEASITGVQVPPAPSP